MDVTRKQAAPATGQSGNVTKGTDEPDWHEWVRRIIAGDDTAKAELVRHYKDGIAIIIARTVHNPSLKEDIAQETFRIAIEKIKNGDLREPERLSGFIISVARNVALDFIRKWRRAANQEEHEIAEEIRDSQPDPFEQLWRKEQAQIVREVISELKSERDRQVLFRYYIAEEDKSSICDSLGLTGLQFNSVIFRALKRFKEIYLKRFGQP